MKAEEKKQTAAHGKCGNLIFQEADDTWTHQTFSQDDLTNIKLYLYFFFFDLGYISLSFSLMLFLSSRPWKSWMEARSLFFHARWKLFLDSLDFFLNNFYTFCFFFSMADASFAFFFFLMLFRTSTFASFLFFPDMNLFPSNRCSVQMTHQVFQEARRLFFHAKHGLTFVHGKTSYPFFLASISLFSWTSAFHAPSPTFHTFTPKQAIQSLFRRTFPASASLKLLSFAETFHFPWIFYFEASGFLLTHQVFNRVRVLFHEAYVFIFLRLRFFLLLFIFLFFASSLIFG